MRNFFSRFMMVVFHLINLALFLMRMVQDGQLNCPATKSHFKRKSNLLNFAISTISPHLSLLVRLLSKSFSFEKVSIFGFTIGWCVPFSFFKIFNCHLNLTLWGRIWHDGDLKLSHVLWRYMWRYIWRYMWRYMWRYIWRYMWGWMWRYILWSKLI